MARLKRIHVNKHKIAANLKGKEHQPALAVRVGKEVLYGNEIYIDGPSRLVDAEQCGMRPLSCGARVYIETKAKVTVTENDGWQTIVD